MVEQNWPKNLFNNKKTPGMDLGPFLDEMSMEYLGSKRDQELLKCFVRINIICDETIKVSTDYTKR